MIRQKVLEEDASSFVGNYIHLPHMAILICFYVRALFKLLMDPQYIGIAVKSENEMYENHLGNYAILKKAPETWMVASHMIMALFWVTGTLVQKLLVRGMAKNLSIYRKIHIIMGISMCGVGIFGCSVGGFIAFRDHKHQPMRWFLMLLPCSFLPTIIMTWVSARKRNVINHRFWATSAFVGPCLSSLWAEELIYRLGRQTFLGPRGGELWGTGIATALHLLVVIYPAWLVSRDQLRRYNKNKNTEISDKDSSLQLTNSSAPIPDRIKCQ
jgi:hypothetical protein